MDDLILTVAGAHQEHSAYTVNNTSGLNVRDYKDLVVFGQFRDGSTELKKIIFDIFAALFEPSISHITNFALRIPGFKDLPQDDQILTIKLGVFDVWLVHAARLINPMNGRIIFSHGIFLSRQEMALMFGHEFATLLFKFVTWFNRLELYDSEIALYSAVILFREGRCGIQDEESIGKIHKQLVEALKYQIFSDGNSNASLNFLSLIGKQYDIRMLGEKFLEQLGWFRANSTHLKLPALFAEVFDIPKSI